MTNKSDFEKDVIHSNWNYYHSFYDSDIQNSIDNDQEKCIIFSVDRYVNGHKINVGGFADRIKGACLTFACALATNRKFYIKWNNPSPITNTFSQNRILWDFKNKILSHENIDLELNWIDYEGFSKSVMDVIKRGQLEEEVFLGNKNIVIYNNIYRPEFFDNDIYSPILNKFGLNPNNPTTMMHKIFDNLFSFSPKGEVRKKFDEFVQFRRNHSFVVGVQFRTGGDGTWEDPEMDSKNNIDRICAAAISAIADKHANPGFFVTTDSVSVREKLIDKLSGYGEIFNFGVDPVHVDRSADKDVAQLSDFVAAEFCSIGKCDIVIHGAGGFGSTAAAVAGKPAVHYTSLIS